MAQIAPVVIMAAVIVLVLWRRLKAAAKPVKGKGYRILLPVIFIWAGLAGLLNPNLHLTVKEVLLSLLFGLVLSIPMILTTNYEWRDDNQIYPMRSKAFIAAVVGLLVLRLALREYLADLDQAELGMLFFLIAVAYVVPWRIASFIKYRRMLNSPPVPAAIALDKKEDEEPKTP